MLEDGVYCDAYARHNFYVIGVVLIRDDIPIESHTKIIDTNLGKKTTSNHGEEQAILFAKEIYGDKYKIFNDNFGSASKHKVNWIPRSENKFAHRLAARVGRKLWKEKLKEQKKAKQENDKQINISALSYSSGKGGFVKFNSFVNDYCSEWTK
jgi:hypothetical protein